MRSQFVDALSQASSLDSAEERIDRIKTAVARELRSADPTASVRFTDYFNHVAVPDMVLRWKDESRERLLFVRPSGDRKWLNEDLESLRHDRPVIFTLEDLEDGADSRVADQPGASVSLGLLAEKAAVANAWVVDPSAVGAVADERKDSAIIGLLGQALLRGGRGVSTRPYMSELTAATERAFDDAAESRSAPLRSAVGTLQSTLDEQQAGRFTRILRAVWEGNGGLPSEFPAATSVGPLTDDDLTYLMASLNDVPENFWHRVGRNVSTAQLGRLRILDPSKNLQLFMRSNLDRLTAKALRASSRQIGLGEDESFPRWVVDRGCLAIRGEAWIAHIAARKVEELPPPDQAQPLALVDLRRGVGSRVHVTRLEFGKGDRAVSYESKERRSILEDEDLTKLARDVSGLLVEQVSLALSGEGTANVEFATRTAQGPTNSALPLGGLARSVVPLLVKLTPEEAGQLEDLLREPGSLVSGEDGSSELPPEDA